MIPYSRLNRIISAYPAGCPLALKIREVTPISDAVRVRQFSRSNAAKAMTISSAEAAHSRSSPFEK